MSERNHDVDAQAGGHCGECRWIGLWPHPYGAVEYFCERRQELMPSASVDRRHCPEFER